MSGGPDATSGETLWPTGTPRRSGGRDPVVTDHALHTYKKESESNINTRACGSSNNNIQHIIIAILFRLGHVVSISWRQVRIIAHHIDAWYAARL